MILIFILLVPIFICGIEIANMISGDDFNILQLILGASLMVLLLIHLNEPRAIDVYKGKTTLEITYRGDTPMDSVVVWKK